MCGFRTRQLSSFARDVLLVIGLFSWLITVFASVVSSTSPTAFAGVALFFAVVHVWTVSLLFRGTRSRLRFVLLVFVLPVVVLAILNYSIFSRGLGGPLFF